MHIKKGVAVRLLMGVVFTSFLARLVAGHADKSEGYSGFLKTLSPDSEFLTAPIVDDPWRQLVFYAPETIAKLKAAHNAAAKIPRNLPGDIWNDFTKSTKARYVHVARYTVIRNDEKVKPILFTVKLQNCVGIVIRDANSTGLYHFFAEDTDKKLSGFVTNFDPKTSTVYIASSVYSPNTIRVFSIMRQYGFNITGTDIEDVAHIYVDHKELFILGDVNRKNILAGTALAVDAQTGQTTLDRDFFPFKPEQITQHTLTFRVYPFISFRKAPLPYKWDIELASLSTNERNFSCAIQYEHGRINARLKSSIPTKTEPEQSNSEFASLDSVISVLEASQHASSLPAYGYNRLKVIRDKLQQCAAPNAISQVSPHYRFSYNVDETLRFAMVRTNDLARVKYIKILRENGRLTAQISTADPELKAKLEIDYLLKEQPIVIGKENPSYVVFDNQVVDVLDFIKGLTALPEYAENFLGRELNLNVIPPQRAGLIAG
jgi:hypothetical protein